MRRFVLLLTASFLFAPDARAQMGGRPQSKPTQSSPTQNRAVGPRGTGGDDDQEPRSRVVQRGEPTAVAPADPLDIPAELRARIGTDSDLKLPPPEGPTHRSFFPYYEETKGDYRLRLLPPLYLEHTRRLRTPAEDRESLTALLYYHRRSPDVDADVLFPLAWNVRDHQNRVSVFGPVVHREAPHAHDNWLAPLVFEGEREHGGYFHSPLLLTTTHWGAEGAFTLAGPYFRDRTGSDVDWGVAPFVFHGNNGNAEGAAKSYTLIPPLLYYHRDREIDESSLSVIGPVVMKSNPKRSIFDVAPLFFHIDGKPETGGVRESHTTLFPFFHYGTSEAQNLFVIPGYLRRTTPTVDTMITPLFTHATTRNGATSLTMLGPVVPIYYRYDDADTGYRSLGIFPFFFNGGDSSGHTLLTPLYGKVESYGVSRTYWLPPTLTVTQGIHGWETDLHPLIYVGRSDSSSHTVLAPVFWDFAKPTGRTTVGFPFYWRFADATTGSVTQVAGNTLYLQKQTAEGSDWSFHILPVFSYGESPSGYFWNVLFGLAGYDRQAEYAHVKALWVPITVSSPKATAKLE